MGKERNNYLLKDTCDLEKENNIHLKGGRKEKEKSFYKNLFLALIFKMVWK